MLDAAGLGDAAVLPVGAPYRATAATGDLLTGTVWARAANQLALRVDGWGDGLLVLAEQPVTPHQAGRRRDGAARRTGRTTPASPR